MLRRERGFFLFVVVGKQHEVYHITMCMTRTNILITQWKAAAGAGCISLQDISADLDFSLTQFFLFSQARKCFSAAH